MSAATSRTCATRSLSSVSGMVKNCGAWGSIAPPMTVDRMAHLLSHLTSAVIMLHRRKIRKYAEQYSA